MTQSSLVLGSVTLSRFLSVAAGALAAIFSLAAPGAAAVITFDSSPDDSYWVNPIFSGGFTFTDITGEGSLGTAMNLDGGSVNNGTVHLMDWYNDNGLSSKMRMESTGGSLFGLVSFDFTSGYLDGSSIADQLSVTGHDTSGGVVANAIFTRSDYSSVSFTTLTLDSSFREVKYVIFEATGGYNRVGYDNMSTVPEPTSLAVFGIGMCIAGGNATCLRRNRKNQDLTA